MFSSSPLLVEAMKLSLISWNVNGSRNLDRYPSALKLVLSHSIVFLQETFEVESGRFFSPKKFVRFASLARSTAGRPSGGLSTLIAQEFLSNAEVRRIESPVPHFLPIFINKPGFQPLLLGLCVLTRLNNCFLMTVIIRVIIPRLRGTD